MAARKKLEKCEDGIHTKFMFVYDESDESWAMKCLAENDPVRRDDTIIRNVSRVLGKMRGKRGVKKLGSSHFSKAGKIGMERRWAAYRAEKARRAAEEKGE